QWPWVAQVPASVLLLGRQSRSVVPGFRGRPRGDWERQARTSALWHADRCSVRHDHVARRPEASGESERRRGHVLDDDWSRLPIGSERPRERDWRRCRTASRGILKHVRRDELEDWATQVW